MKTICGTPLYAAPEIHVEGNVGYTEKVKDVRVYLFMKRFSDPPIPFLFPKFGNNHPVPNSNRRA